MSDLEKIRPRPTGGEPSRSHRIIDRIPERKPDLDGGLFDLPACEIDIAQARGDPWWVIPAALIMWALVAAGVVMLMMALVV